MSATPPCDKRKHRWTEDDGLRCAVCGATRNARQARHVRVERGIYRNTVTGRFEITYTEDGGQVWQTIAGGLREARAARARVVVKHEQGERAAPSRLTVAALAALWLDAEAGRLRPRTLQTYSGHMQQHVLPLLGRRKATTVKTADVLALLAALRAKKLAAWSQHGVLTALSALFEFGMQGGLGVYDNPVRKLGRGARPSTGESKSLRILSGDEIERLLAATPERYRLALQTAIFTGVRVGELCGLTWEDIDFDAGVLRVRKQLGRDGVRVAPKTKQAVREIVLFPQLAPLLRAHRERAFAQGRARPSDPVFASEAGTPLSIRNLTRRGLERAVTDAGLNIDAEQPVTMHTCRRTFASHLILDLKLDAVQVAKQMGHAKPSITTDAYADLFDRVRHHDEIRDAMGASAFGAVLATSGATRTGGETRQQSGAADTGNVAFLRDSATGGDR